MELKARRYATVVAAVVLLSVPRAASAGGPTAADRETARTLMDQGRDLRDKGQMKEALKRFQAANEIMHVPTTALEVARSQVAVGLLVEARDTIATSRQTVAARESEVFKQARAAAETLDASLAGRMPALTITVKGAAPGDDVAVAVDGVPVPSAVVGLSRAVNPGHHVITAKTSNGEGRREFDIREGEQKPVEVALVVTSAPVAVTPEAAPAEPAEAAPAKSHSPTKYTYIGIGVAGAGIVAGTVTGVLSLSKKSTLAGECTNDVCGPSSASTLSSANTLATVSDVSFVIAGAGAAFAIVTLVRGHGGPSSLPPSASASSAVHLTPWFAGSAAGVLGTF